jgi:TRAP-type C4-dicarboxylate transport system permease small subunit
MEFFNKILEKYLSKLVDGMVILILAALVVDVFISICCRYVLNLPLAWSEELARILLVWLTFIGGAAASRRNKHLNIDDLFNKLNPKAQKATSFLINALASLFLVFLIVKGISMAWEFRNHLTEALQIPTTFLYLAIPVGSLLMLPYNVRNMVTVGLGGKK